MKKKIVTLLLTTAMILSGCISVYASEKYDNHLNVGNRVKVEVPASDKKACGSAMDDLQHKWSSLGCLSGQSNEMYKKYWEAMKNIYESAQYFDKNSCYEALLDAFMHGRPDCGNKDDDPDEGTDGDGPNVGATPEIPDTIRELGQQIVDYAMSWVGVTPYVSSWDRLDEYGNISNSLITGTDAAGFVSLIYGTYGISLPTSCDLYQNDVGIAVQKEELMPGDLVVYRYGGDVAIYAGVDETGTEMVIHCQKADVGTICHEMYFTEPTQYVRVIE